MTNAKSFQDEWITAAEKDPYAALGISLNAEDRRILKRYRQIAKLLHPDVQAGNSAPISQTAEQLIAKVINPAYQQLKQEKSRSEVLANMRFRAGQLDRQGKLKPSFESAQQLLRIPEDEVDGFYENTLTQLANQQFDSSAVFHKTLPRLAQLNLILLRRKMGDTVIRPKRTGLVAAPNPVKVSTADMTTAVAAPEPPVINYAERYGIRARTYLSQRSYDQAIQELREGIKIEPNNVEFHSMLGQAYLMQKKYGMSRVHLKRALALNPVHAIAKKYLDRLETLAQSSKNSVTSTVEAKANGDERGWLGRIFHR